MWAGVVLIVAGLAGVFVSQIFDTGWLTLLLSILVMLVGMGNPGLWMPKGIIKNERSGVHIEQM